MDSKTLEAFLVARDYIDRDIVRQEPRIRDRERKVATAIQFNTDLGQPQRAYPSIQVSGTSGKGSVCSFLAEILTEAGYSTGLHVSPYLQVITEKTWIDRKYCSAGEFAKAVDRVRPVADRYAADDACPASVHGMASLATSYEVFKERNIDVAVMETGLGGRFDLVQGLDKALTVVTDLGLDHTKSLGDTIESIAWHKAGIMEAGVPCVCIMGAGSSVLQAEADRLGVELTFVEPNKVVSSVTVRDSSSMEIELSLPVLGDVPVYINSRAVFQIRNVALAAMAVDQLVDMGWKISRQNLIDGIAKQRYPGRYEMMPSEQKVILDGAHNQQKLASLLKALRKDYPLRKTTVLMALTGSKEPGPFIDMLKDSTEILIATWLDMYGKVVLPPEFLAKAASDRALDARVVRDAGEALVEALDVSRGGILLVTGSLYLIGRARDHWFPWREVLAKQTSWPNSV